MLENILTNKELQLYRDFYHEVMEGKLAESAKPHRHDLGNHVDRKVSSVENITQGKCVPSIKYLYGST